MVYQPKIGDHVIVDMAILKKTKRERMGTIINTSSRINGRDYETIYFIRTGFRNDVVQCKYGQFTRLTRRYLDEYESKQS